MKNTVGYLESWSKEIQSSANTVRDLIGAAHWLSDGHHREAVLRDFISRYVPNSVSVDSGFIKPPNMIEACSREIDILMSDLQSHTPYYSRGGLTIIPPQSLLACIEVKSAWSKKKLTEAFVNVAETQIITQKYCPSNSIWRGICFYGDLTPSEAAKMAISMQVVIKDSVIPVIKPSNHNNLDASAILQHLPTCVFNLKGFVLFFSLSRNEKSISLRVFNCKEASPALALLDMLDCVRNRVCGITNDDISEMIESIDGSDLVTTELELGLINE